MADTAQYDEQYRVLEQRLAMAQSGGGMGIVNTGNAAAIQAEMRQVVADRDKAVSGEAAANKKWYDDRAGGGSMSLTGQDKYWADKAKADADASAAQTNRLIEVTRDYFRRNGMEAFINGMDKYIRAGYSGEDVMVMLSNDADYKEAWTKRFAGNAERVKNGLSELLPASYIAMEQGYKQAMLKHQMPATLFDDANDFAALIANDVSAVEVNDRLQKASDYINYSGNAEVKRQLRDLYGMSDSEMAAYVLDPKKTMTYLDSESRRNLNRANVGGAAVTQGVGIENSLRDEIGNYYDSVNSAYTSTYADSTTKFGKVAEESPAYQRLGALSSEVATADELVREQFSLTGAADVTTKKKGLASQERARFSGQSGLGASSLSAGRMAQ